MTKKELMELLHNNPPCESECEKHIRKIEGLLYAYPDQTNIEGVSSVDEFKRRGGFVVSGLDSEERKFENELNSMVNGLQDWILRSQTCVSKDSLDGLNVAVDKLEAARVGREAIVRDYISNQTRRTGFKFQFFKFGIVALILVSLAFTCMSFFEAFGNWGQYVGAIIGALDFCFGLGFQLYERNDDIKRGKNARDMNHDIIEKEKQINQTTIEEAKIYAQKVYIQNNYDGTNSQGEFHSYGG